MLKFLKKNRAQGTIEYVLLVALLVGVTLLVGSLFKKQIKDIVTKMFDKVSKQLDTLTK